MAGDGDGDWTDDRLETTHREARVVLEAQNNAISDIDDKAMRTVRITIVLVGIVVAAARIGGTGIFNRYLFAAGNGILLVSLITGVLTYSESNLYIGPNKDYIVQLVNDDFQETRWDRDILETYADWIEENFEDVRWNGFLLFVTQILMLAGIVSLVLSVAF